MSAQTMTTVSHDTVAHRFATEVEGHVGVLDYLLREGVMTITHTGVPTAIGGRGVAADLMKAALKAARDAGWKVDPACSYAAAYMRRHHDDPQKEHEDDLLDEALDESFPASDSPSVGRSN
jgi:predicted GNAT family acetyltransferase